MLNHIVDNIEQCCQQKTLFNPVFVKPEKACLFFLFTCVSRFESLVQIFLTQYFLAVSAFYVECPQKNMCMNCHVWTKSKFYGMSIGVELIGDGKL